MYGKIQYNHRLNYENNDNINNGTEGNNNRYSSGYYTNNNWHNTTLLFDNFIITSCTIWYCLNDDYSEGKGASIVSWGFIHKYGLIEYNHKLVYRNTKDAITNGIIGNRNEFTDNDWWWNNHNTTLLFGNLSNIFFTQTIPSCTIWYCINGDYYHGKNAAAVSYNWGFNYARIWYNHRLNYDNNSNMYNATVGDSNYYYNTGNNCEYNNCHNTPLLQFE